MNFFMNKCNLRKNIKLRSDRSDRLLRINIIIYQENLYHQAI